MPTETQQTRALRSQIGYVAADMKRNAEKRQFASARATTFRAQAQQISEHLRGGSPEVLQRTVRNDLTKYRDALYEVAKQESIVLELAFANRLLEKKHQELATQLEAAVRAANQPVASRR